MADIFISYKKEDAGRVIRIVEGLREEGFSVWWDHGIAPGAHWDQTIQTELNAAKAVIAIWSEQSVAAPWVKEEANVGKNRGVLLPIRIDAVDPPLGFSLIQMGDLVGWSGDRSDPHWGLVLGALRAIIKGERPVGLEAAPRRKQSSWKLLAALGVAALIAIAVIVGYFALRDLTQVTYTRETQTAQAPTTVTISRQSQTNPSPPQEAAAAGAQEAAAWAQATAQRTRQGFQSYLIAFPNGAYAARARDILLTCRTEMRDQWVAQTAGQMLRGVNGDPAPTQSAACSAARAFAVATWDRTCRAFAANDPANARNPQSNMVDAECDCRQTPGGWFCTVDPSFTCQWERRQQQQAEICGG